MDDPPLPAKGNDARVSTEELHVAMPRLYGAPATARPPAVVKEAPRPFDPDEMPVQAQLTDEERSFIESLPPHAFLPGGGYYLGGGSQDEERAGDKQPLFLRSLVGRLFGSS